MTREEAIKVLRAESVEIGGNAVSVFQFLEALDMAVKALEDVTDKDVGKNEPLTNAQKIRAMNDEELTKMLWKAGRNYRSICADPVVDYNEHYKHLIEWLQQPAKEDDHDERKENEHV